MTAEQALGAAGRRVHTAYVQTQARREEKGIRIATGVFIGAALVVLGHLALWVVTRFLELDGFLVADLSDGILAVGGLLTVAYLFRHRRSHSR